MRLKEDKDKENHIRNLNIELQQVNETEDINEKLEAIKQAMKRSKIGCENKIERKCGSMTKVEKNCKK